MSDISIEKYLCDSKISLQALLPVVNDLPDGERKIAIIRNVASIEASLQSLSDVFQSDDKANQNNIEFAEAYKSMQLAVVFRYMHKFNKIRY